MCSMVDYEMLVSHSPPIFHNLPSGYVSNYKPYCYEPDRFYKTALENFSPLANAGFYNNTKRTPSTPKRPCLVVRPEDNAKLIKKKVVFADDKGMSLTHIRIITEPPHVPPMWTLQFLAEITNKTYADLVEQKESWEVTFPQPASDYVDFRKKLNSAKVSLENVIVKESDNTILGTVKVSNIAFHKEVIVRLSFDGWNTHEDILCSYVPNNVTNSPTKVLYDTFSFNISLMPDANKLEFCICFKSEGCEYWDSNNSKNYVIVKRTQPIAIQKKQERSVDEKNNRVADVIHTKLDSWSEFASWNHLDNTNPYW